MRSARSEALSSERVPTTSFGSRRDGMKQDSIPEATPQTAGVTFPAAGEDDRILAALSYPLWPVALFLVALRGKVSSFVRYHALQALLVNALGVGAYFVYSAAANLPVVGWQSAFVLPLLLPAWFIINLYLGIRAYGGHVTRVPLAAEYAQRHSR
jgi:uncharacterized membrane protein